MSNKPFISQNTNIFSENKYNSVPGNIGAQPVLITQSSQRRIVDQKSLTITKNDFPRSFCCNSMPINSQPQAVQSLNILCGQKEYFPGGISYTFNHLGHSCAYQGNKLINNRQNSCNEMNGTPLYSQLPQPPLTLQQQIALKQLEKEGLELTLMQERLKLNPFQLRFHQDCKTSTSDLTNAINQINASEGFPVYKDTCIEFSNLKNDGKLATNQLVQCENPACLYTSKKKLVLTKTPDLQKHTSGFETCYCKETQTNKNENSETSCSCSESSDDQQDINSDNKESSDSSYNEGENKKKSKRQSKKRTNSKTSNGKEKNKKNKKRKKTNLKSNDSEESTCYYKLCKRSKSGQVEEKQNSTDCSCDSLNSSKGSR